MNTGNNLKLEVPDIFYPAFLKAVKRCNSENKKMILCFQDFNKERKHIIEVATDKRENYFFLGKYYATYRGEM